MSDVNPPDFEEIVARMQDREAAKPDQNSTPADPSRVLPVSAKIIEDIKLATEAKVGDIMPDTHPRAGWIFGGISKTTNAPFYVAPKDTGFLKWEEASAAAGFEKARLPSQDELKQIFWARKQGALKDTFNETASDAPGRYWSSTRPANGLTDFVCSLDFRKGVEMATHKRCIAALRLVRD